MPLFRKASSRSRTDRISKLNEVVVNIVLSGVKVIIVPLIFVSPVFLTSSNGFPLSYSWIYTSPSRCISAFKFADNAFTQETPTP